MQVGRIGGAVAREAVGNWKAARPAILALVAHLFLLPAAMALGQRLPEPPPEGPLNLWDAIDQQRVVARVIAHSPHRVTILLSNPAGREERIVLPESFLAYPLDGSRAGGRSSLAEAVSRYQRLGGCFRPGSLARKGQNEEGQGVRAELERPVVVLAPGQRVRGEFATVCLDFGKDDPNPRVPYQLVPPDQYVRHPHVLELLKVWSRTPLPVMTVQLAAWHFENGLSWQQMLLLGRGPDRRMALYFLPQRVVQARELAERVAALAAEQHGKPPAP